jgi:two-component system cell cycle response regulator DivK
MNVPPTEPLPRSPAMSQDRDHSPETDGGPRRVLLADDERLLHTVLGDVLEAYGYAVLHAMDGEQAVREARESRPDVILMDIMMPVMTGLEALEALKGDEETRGIPVVAITADVLGRTREDMLHRGFDGYIPKPFTAGQLIGEIAKHAGAA